MNNDGIDDVIVGPYYADRSPHDIVAVCRGVRQEHRASRNVTGKYV